MVSGKRCPAKLRTFLLARNATIKRMSALQPGTGVGFLVNFTTRLAEIRRTVGTYNYLDHLPSLSALVKNSIEKARKDSAHSKSYTIHHAKSIRNSEGDWKNRIDRQRRYTRHSGHVRHYFSDLCCLAHWSGVRDHLRKSESGGVPLKPCDRTTNVV